MLVLRQPGALFAASFWAEDGWFWYPGAYNDGWRSLLAPVSGYLQTISRLVALGIQPFPLAWAPTLFAIAALVVQVAPATLVVTARFDRDWPALAPRALFATMLIALPNSYETSLNLDNAQWHLSLLAFLVIVADPPRQWTGRSFDTLTLILSGLTGPRCLFLSPIAVWRAATMRTRERLRQMAIVLATCGIQLWFLWNTMHAARPHAPLGANAVSLARILGFQVIGGAEVGLHNIRGLMRLHGGVTDAAAIAISVASAALAVRAFAYGRPQLRMLMLFAALLFAAVLASPAVSETEPGWIVMANQAGIGNRYYLIPMVAWLATLFSLTADRLWLVRQFAVTLLVFVGLWAIPADWKQPHLARPEFAARAREMATAPVGTQIAFPIAPAWAPPMILVKHSDK